MLFSKVRKAECRVVSSENTWDDIQRSSAHRRALQSDILLHFKDSTAGDIQMENLRRDFQNAIKQFNNTGHKWLAPQKLATKLMAVRQIHTRNKFERRFFYHNPMDVSFIDSLILNDAFMQR